MITKDDSFILPLGAVQQLRNAQRGRGLRDALRTVVNVTFKSVTKGGGGVKNRPKYVIVERPLIDVSQAVSDTCAIPATEWHQATLAGKTSGGLQTSAREDELEWDERERRDSQRGQSWAEMQTRQPPILPGPKSAYTNSVEETIQACMPSPQYQGQK